MSQPSSGPVSGVTLNSAEQDPQVKMTPKIYVTGLSEGDDEKIVRLLFSSYGEVLEVIVDGTCATVTFNDEAIVKQLEDQQTIMSGDRRLHIARVLEEQQVEAPFYIAGAPTSYPCPDMGLSSSYPSYQPPSFPMWYPPPPTAASSFYDPAITDCGPVHHVPPHMLPASYNQYSVPPPTPTEQGNYDNNVFSFDITPSMASQSEQYKYPPRPKLGCCHVCSTPSVQGVAPLHTHHTQSYGNQLQPLTPMTPSLNTGYMYPPTPTPTLLPPMTPNYYLPPTPSYMMYHPNGFTHVPDVPTVHPSYYTKLKPSFNGSSVEEPPMPINNQANPMVYFTSPFKRFTKFSGTPSKARFPIQAAASPQSYRGRSSLGPSKGGEGKNTNWYQQGDRWGQKSGAEVDVQKESGPDLVRDCGEGRRN